MWTPRKSKPRSDPNLNLNLDTKDPNLDTQKTEDRARRSTPYVTPDPNLNLDTQTKPGHPKTQEHR